METETSTTAAVTGKKKKKALPGYQADFIAVVISDFESFIQECSNSPDSLSDFASFLRLWRTCGLSLIYSVGFTTLSTTTILRAVYHRLVTIFIGGNVTENVKVALLLTLYCLYYCQPVGGGRARFPIPVTPQCFSALKTLYRQLSVKEPIHYAAYMFYRLCQDNAFQLTMRFSTIPVKGGGGSSSTTTAIDIMGNEFNESIAKVSKVMSSELIEGQDDLAMVANSYEQIMDRTRAITRLTDPRFITKLEQATHGTGDNLMILSQPTPTNTYLPVGKKRLRRNTLPERPSTAPPHLERNRMPSASAVINNGFNSVRSVSPFGYLSLDVDMPDFTLFTQQ